MTIVLTVLGLFTFNKFDIVTDQGSCEHVFDIAECYRTMHNLAKPGGYIIIAQATWKGNG